MHSSHGTRRGGGVFLGLRRRSLGRLLGGGGFFALFRVLYVRRVLLPLGICRLFGLSRPRLLLPAVVAALAARLLLGLFLRLDLLAGTADDAGGDFRPLLGLGAGGGGKGGLGRLGYGGLVGRFIGHFYLGGRGADAKKAGLCILQNLDGDAVPVHLELCQSRRDGKINGLAGCDNKLFHSYSLFFSLP